MATQWLSVTVPAGTAHSDEGRSLGVVVNADAPVTAAGLTAADTFGAAIVAITGDTYTAGTHQFSAFGGATGLTHAQVATNFATLNTALADLAAANTSLAPSNGVLVAYDGALSKNQLRSALRAILRSLGSAT